MRSKNLGLDWAMDWSKPQAKQWQKTFAKKRSYFENCKSHIAKEDGKQITPIKKKP